ncbi:MAG: redoxin family protein [Fimbriimonadia bacterium]|nr:redoxin family protein [Fimbriimonadia bacterium]
MKGFVCGTIILTALLSFSLTDQSYEITRKHNVLTETRAAASTVKVGSRLPALTFQDIKGKSYNLQTLAQKGPVAVVFMGVACPVAQRYTTRLNTLQQTYAKKGVSLIAVNSNYDESLEATRKHAAEMKFKFPVVKDETGQIAQAFGATMTPQAFVVDQKAAIRYRGAIDDNRYETRVKHTYLRDALDAILNKKTVKVATSESFGCTLRAPEEAKGATAINYAKHIAPILQENCQSCHRPGQVAPFELMTYDDAYAWRKEIKKYTQTRLMPPWKPEPGHGDFKGEKRLSNEEIKIIARWVESGAPMGDPKDLPAPRKFPNDWALGKPDFVVEMPEEYEIGPEGEDEYRHFVIPTNFNQDVYVQAIDVEPGNRKTVHHVIVYLDTSGTARRLDAADKGAGYSAFGWPGFMPAGTLGGWAPGMTPSVLPEATGYRIPKGADIVLQVHYYRTGKVERDRSRVGLYFSKAPNTQPVSIGVAINAWFRIPPGDKRHEVKAYWSAPRDVEVVAITPHMHLLGKEMKITAYPPSGDPVPMVWIKDWDFNWQDNYHYKSPVKLPKGTRIEVVSYYDNSEENPRNPHSPPKPVTWGEKTSDEMCLAFFHVVGELEGGFGGGGLGGGNRGGGGLRRLLNPGN